MQINCSHHYTFIDKLLPGSFQTTAKISRVGNAHPDFFQGGRLPTLLPRAGAHGDGPNVPEIFVTYMGA